MIIRYIYRYSTVLASITLVIYIYMIVAYFLYSNSDTLSFADNNIRKSIHTHKKGFINEDIESFRNNRFQKAKNRPIQITGPGEDGDAVYLTDEEQKLADKLFKKETFNVVASNKIAMDRRIKDIRHADCKNYKYDEDLPTASVVIVFCNEAPSGLLRTAHSVVNRSPPKYLYEVLLIDDASDRPELMEDLEKYVTTVWPDGIVKLVRATERMGLIKGKVFGAKQAKGDVLVFLDAHCEVADYWLEPILARIKESPSTVVCPMVDAIDDKTLQFSQQGGIAVGGFTWSLHFTWRSVPLSEQKRRKSPAEPVRSPTMAGGLLAANRKYFFNIGAYDTGMFVWGGENLELSFRVWMCGGSLEFIPCSRVGHIFRSAHPYAFNKPDSHGYNSKRLAEVWMDDYKRLYYNHRRDLMNADVGNYSDRIMLRKRLNCKNFKWYLDNVFPEQFIIDENSQAYGMVRNPASGLCLDTMGKAEHSKFHLSVFSCSGGISNNQLMGLSKINELRMEEICMDALGTKGSPVVAQDCHESGGNQEWFHNRENKKIYHSSGLCLDIKEVRNGGEVMLNTCSNSDSQIWEFEKYLKMMTLTQSFMNIS